MSKLHLELVKNFGALVELGLVKPLEFDADEAEAGKQAIAVLEKLDTDKIVPETMEADAFDICVGTLDSITEAAKVAEEKEAKTTKAPKEAKAAKVVKSDEDKAKAKLEKETKAKEVKEAKAAKVVKSDEDKAKAKLEKETKAKEVKEAKEKAKAEKEANKTPKAEPVKRDIFGFALTSHSHQLGKMVLRKNGTTMKEIVDADWNVNHKTMNNPFRKIVEKGLAERKDGRLIATQAARDAVAAK